MENNQKIINAFHWFLDLLHQNSSPYLLVGRAAVVAYGADRPLEEFDFYVPQQKLEQICDAAKDFITFGPERYQDDLWDIEGAQFVYDGVIIEITSDENVRFFCAKEGGWIKQYIDFNHYQKLELLGRNVRVMEREQLLDYKQLLDRDDDKIDVALLLQQ